MIFMFELGKNVGVKVVFFVEVFFGKFVMFKGEFFWFDVVEVGRGVLNVKRVDVGFVVVMGLVCVNKELNFEMVIDIRVVIEGEIFIEMRNVISYVGD